MRWLSLVLLGACAPSPLTVGKSTQTTTEEPTDSGADPLPPADQDNDGTPDAQDCAPSDATIHPGATEVCNGKDDNCDGTVDEGVMLTGYEDLDGDGYGNADQTRETCTFGTGIVAQDGDCDDADANVHPDQTDTCDGRDSDCDFVIDEDGAVPIWMDADGDGWGDNNVASEGCPTVVWASQGGDCDDTNRDVHPGATETCNTIDDDCDGQADSSAVCPCDVEYWPDLQHPYLFCEATSDWQTASDTCASLGYALVTFDSEAEGLWVESTIFTYPDNFWWIGFTDATSEGNWIWDDGSPVTYINWASGEPNNGHGWECVSNSEEDCAMLKWSGAAWNDYPCGCGWPSSVCEGASVYRPQ